MTDRQAIVYCRDSISFHKEELQNIFDNEKSLSSTLEVKDSNIKIIYTFLKLPMDLLNRRIFI